MRRFFLAALALLEITAVRASAGDTAGPEWAAFGEPGQTAGRIVSVSATDTTFTPDRVVVTRGETIEFKVGNHGALAHEFVIGDQAFHDAHAKEMAAMPGMAMKEANALDLKPGENGSLTWHFTKPGMFLFACDIPGHREAGMVGKLEVR